MSLLINKCESYFLMRKTLTKNAIPKVFLRSKIIRSRRFLNDCQDVVCPGKKVLYCFIKSHPFNMNHCIAISHTS